MKSAFFAVLFLSTVALARIPDQKVHLSAKGSQVVGKIDAGYHFNIEAPAELQSRDGKINVPPVKKEEKLLVFDTAKVKGQPFSLDFYVCDDAKTVCESHGGNFQIVGNQLKTLGINKGLPNADSSTVAAEPRSSLKVNTHGFIENDLAGALQKAKAQGKKVLVDFRAPWCPACIRLETEVFDQKNFQAATRELIKVSLNVDLPGNKALADQYSAKAIPTLVLMDSSGNELFRSLDYKPAAVLSSEIRAAVKNEKMTYAQLQKKAEAGDKKAASVLGRREFKALNYAEALRWLSKAKDDGLMSAISEVEISRENADQNKKLKGAYLEALKKNIAHFPESFEAIQWRNDWARAVTDTKLASADEVKAVLSTNIQKIDGLMENKAQRELVFKQNLLSDFSHFERAELLSQKIDSMKLLAPSSEAPTVKELAAEIEKVKLDTERPGEILIAAGYMNQAGEKAQVEAWYGKLTKAYPDNYVYYRRLARFYVNEKNFSKALEPALKSAELGTDLPLENLELLAKVQKELSQKAEAQKTVLKALSLPEAKLESKRRVVKSLEELKKTL